MHSSSLASSIATNLDLVPDSRGCSVYCGRGDKKTARGKRFNHSFGNARPKDKNKGRGPPRVSVPPAPPRKDKYDDGELNKNGKDFEIKQGGGPPTGGISLATKPSSKNIDNDTRADSALKATIVKNFDDDVRGRNDGHYLFTSIVKYPSKVTHKDSAKKLSVEAFVKAKKQNGRIAYVVVMGGNCGGVGVISFQKEDALLEFCVLLELRTLFELQKEYALLELRKIDALLELRALLEFQKEECSLRALENIYALLELC
ncbi:unnamed protein product [Fraxinus pennsylvanica]|uniref:Uncharacterized protein n=1 Tax=Fraxinus pennsylvanica TaxID=56036 RepID=A0AAD2DY16_9LAMI|nr:unnamed protein product [Fraxinus pennsylvanica]